MTRTYTADDLLAQSAYSTGESYTFAYTPAHRISSVTDQAGRAQTFAYNPIGWLTGNSDTTDGTAFATTYAYDAAGRVTTLDTDAAPALTYAYDLAGRLTSLESSGAVTAFAHDAAGARTAMSLPNGAATSYAYDPAGRIESIVTTATSGVIAWDYTRDAAGRVSSDAGGSYTYDDAGRLITWEAPSGEVTTYTYDAASNLTGASVDGSATAHFAFDAAERITNAGYTYDAAGNLTSDGTRIFTYDAACRLVAVADASTETTIATYTYDSFNRRTSSTEGTAAVFFHYDGASARVLAETDLLGSVLASYTYDDSGQLHSMSREGATYYYHLNARGDVVALTDGTGAVVNTYAYDPWGQLLSADETVSNPYRYASYRYDGESGLYYCWNRYYAPSLARFITRDIYPGELADPVSMNPYLYCAGDPVNAVDPSGMWTVSGGMGYQFAVLTLGYTRMRSIAMDAEGFGDYMTEGGLVSLPCEASAGFNFTMTNAPSLEMLEGDSKRLGVSMGAPFGFSVDFLWSDKYMGLAFTGGLAADFPAALHVAVEETRYLPPTNRYIGVQTPVPIGSQDDLDGLRSIEY